MNKAGIGAAVVLLFMGWAVAHAGYTGPGVSGLYFPPTVEIRHPMSSGDFLSRSWLPVTADTNGISPPFSRRRLLPDRPIPSGLFPADDTLGPLGFADDTTPYTMRSFPAGIRMPAGPSVSSRDVVGIYVNVSGVDGFLHTPDTALPVPTALLLGSLGTTLVVWMRRRRIV